MDDMTWQNYLAHFGIKGMMWGRRRPDGADGTVTSGLKGANKPTEGGPDHNGDGRSDRLSADAERTLHTLSKPGSELSTREMKEALERAKQVDQYNKLFNPQAPGNPEIQKKIDELRQVRDLRALEAELAPPPKVAKFIKAAGLGFGAYQQLDRQLDGSLTKGLKAKIGLVEATDKTKSDADLRTAQADLIAARAKIVEADNRFNTATSAAAAAKPPAAAVAVAQKLVHPEPSSPVVKAFSSFKAPAKSVSDHLVTGTDGRVRPKPGFGWDGHPLDTSRKTNAWWLNPDGSLGHH